MSMESIGSHSYTYVVKSLVDEAVDELVREEVEGYISDTLQSDFTESQAALLTSTLIVLL